LTRIALNSQSFVVKTPSHYVLNLALLGTLFAPEATAAIAAGALLPDLPIFVLYFVAKFAYKRPERQIWSETYYEPFWQTWVAFGHSLPLGAIAAVICFSQGWTVGGLFSLSFILHSLLDLPVHHSDAHRHFFPFSNYRFISPFSYWNPKYHGRIVAFVELLLVLAATPFAFSLLKTWVSQGILVGINALYILSYLRSSRRAIGH